MSSATTTATTTMATDINSWTPHATGTAGEGQGLETDASRALSGKFFLLMYF